MINVRYIQRTAENTAMYYCKRCAAYFADWNTLKSCPRFDRATKTVCGCFLKRVIKQEYV